VSPARLAAVARRSGGGATSRDVPTSSPAAWTPQSSSRSRPGCCEAARPRAAAALGKTSLPSPSLPCALVCAWATRPADRERREGAPHTNCPPLL
jgi:hypothetical protein